jgi:hypothetical protein
MKPRLSLIFGAILLLIPSIADAQLTQNAKPVPKKQPQKVSEAFVRQLRNKGRFSRTNRMSSDAKEAMSQQRIKSVPHWQGSFVTTGTSYPYIMAGGNPRAGDTTAINTSIIPISLVFDEFVDQTGNSIFVDVSPFVKLVRNSPNFERASYSTGFTQFADAVQRAEFWNVKRDDWHTTLDRPRSLTPVTVEVPVGASQLFQLDDGTFVTILDEGFFISQLNTIIQLEDLRTDELPIALAPNVLLADLTGDGSCCVLGFHTAFETSQQGNVFFVQTFAFASYLHDGLFDDPTFTDVVALSHEISEFVNDPFINNVVPTWQQPGAPAGDCQSLLETGDPIEELNDAGFPVTVDGVTFHPQNEALLQWFSRQKPSSAIGGAYSYPDSTLLTGPSQACSAAATK